MSLTAGAYDASDPALPTSIQNFLAANGGQFGNSSTNTSISSAIQGVISISGAVNLDFIDANAAPVYAAHEEFDTVVPCGTSTSIPGFTAAGGCDMVPAFLAASVPAELYLLAGSTGHVGFTVPQFTEILDGAAAFMLHEVVAPTP
ncbi:MAG: hypothetical protein AAF986_02075 [Pseudomonadota bacterium]